jgi:AcrR family transcriptional regulator
MGTRDRIIEAGLQLFNEKGERAVTTNHIAAHLGISPGNLYYHFRNKQAIIAVLFENYQLRISETLSLPEGRSIEPGDKLRYLTGVFNEIWAYRFMHRDMEHLLEADPALHEEYRAFFRLCLTRIEAIFTALGEAGILSVTKQDCHDLALNTWIIVTSWFSFLKCHLPVQTQNGITQDMLKGGIYQIFCLERPYLTAEHKDEMLALQQSFIPQPDWTLGQ